MDYKEFFRHYGDRDLGLLLHLQEVDESLNIEELYQAFEDRLFMALTRIGSELVIRRE